MKDLKHLIYFEHLLDEAANELVTQAVSEGRHSVGYTCYHMPEVLLFRASARTAHGVA